MKTGFTQEQLYKNNFFKKNFKLIIIMPKYVIEREIPGAGKFSSEQLKSISQTSCGVLSKMGNTFVTE